MVVYGKIAEITRSEESTFLSNYLLEATMPKSKENDLLIKKMIEKIGIHKTCSLLNYCDESLPLLKKETLLSRFIDYALTFNFISNEDHKNILNHFKKDNEFILVTEERKQEDNNKIHLISAANTINFSECLEKESIHQTIPGNFNSYFEGLAASNSLETGGNSLIFGHLGSDYDQSLRSNWSERD